MEMKRFYMSSFYFFLLLSTSCKLFKKVRTKTVSDMQQTKEVLKGSLTAHQLMRTDQHVVAWTLDSSASSSVVQIWPKGKFRFSQELGFEGEAEQVLLTGNFRKNVAALVMKDSAGTTSNQLKAEILGKKETKLETMDTVKTETPPFWLIIGLVVLVIIAAACIFSFCGK